MGLQTTTSGLAQLPDCTEARKEMIITALNELMPEEETDALFLLEQLKKQLFTSVIKITPSDKVIANEDILDYDCIKLVILLLILNDMEKVGYSNSNADSLFLRNRRREIISDLLKIVNWFISFLNPHEDDLSNNKPSNIIFKYSKIHDLLNGQLCQTSGMCVLKIRLKNPDGVYEYERTLVNNLANADGQENEFCFDLRKFTPKNNYSIYVFEHISELMKYTKMFEFEFKVLVKVYAVDEQCKNIAVKILISQLIQDFTYNYFEMTESHPVDTSQSNDQVIDCLINSKANFLFGFILKFLAESIKDKIDNPDLLILATPNPYNQTSVNELFEMVTLREFEDLKKTKIGAKKKRSQKQLPTFVLSTGPRNRFFPGNQ